MQPTRVGLHFLTFRPGCENPEEGRIRTGGSPLGKPLKIKYPMAFYHVTSQTHVQYGYEIMIPDRRDE